MTIAVGVCCGLLLFGVVLWLTCFSGLIITSANVAEELQETLTGPAPAGPGTLVVTTEGAELWWETRLAEVEATCDDLRREGREQDADELSSATRREHDEWLALDETARRRWVTERVEAGD
ncbi:MAG: hypothetical protein ACYTG1_02915 [Planctomycetota bacterium]